MCVRVRVRVYACVHVQHGQLVVAPPRWRNGIHIPTLACGYLALFASMDLYHLRADRIPRSVTNCTDVVPARRFHVVDAVPDGRCLMHNMRLGSILCIPQVGTTPCDCPRLQVLSLLLSYFEVLGFARTPGRQNLKHLILFYGPAKTRGLGLLEIVDLGHLGGPGGPRTLPRGGEQSPPPFGVPGAAGVAQTLKIDDVRSAQNPC